MLTDPLLERLATHETDVNVIRVKKMEEGEHCDFFWWVPLLTIASRSLR